MMEKTHGNGESSSLVTIARGQGGVIGEYVTVLVHRTQTFHVPHHRETDRPHLHEKLGYLAI